MMVNLINSDFRDVNFSASANEFQLIFCDPPYIKESIGIYKDLAKLAANVLTDHGSLVCYAGHYNLPDYLKLMTPHLDFWWIMAMIHQTGIGFRNAFPMNHRKVIPTWKPLLWFVKKGCSYKGRYINDSVMSRKPNKLLHAWEQSPVEAMHVIGRLTEEGQHVLDPFMGSGTTGVAAISLNRQFTGIELNKQTYDIASRRLAEVKPATKITSF